MWEHKERYVGDLLRTIHRLVVDRVDPSAVYHTSYTIAPNGEKYPGDFRLYGRDLTADQIVELAIQGVFDNV